MKVTLTRPKRYFTGKSKVKVRLDGAVVAEINGDETVDIELTKQEAVLQLKQLTAKSNKLRVSDGDHIDTEASLWAYIMPLVQAVIFTILLFTYDYFQSMGIFEGRPFWFFLLIIPLAALISGIPRMLFDTFVIFNENEKVAYRDHKFQ